jgi:hypothetical protein
LVENVGKDQRRDDDDALARVGLGWAECQGPAVDLSELAGHANGSRVDVDVTATQRGQRGEPSAPVTLSACQLVAAPIMLALALAVTGARRSQVGSR